jgi:hypothetical protein
VGKLSKRYFILWICHNAFVLIDKIINYVKQLFIECSVGN